MHLNKTPHESKSVPGVRFTTRTLNSIQRARRDASIAEHRREYTRLTTELQLLVSKHVKGETGEERAACYEALPLDVKLSIQRLEDESRIVLDQHITPAVIEAALVSIEGETFTLENLADEAPDALIEEIVTACSAASGLTADQQKN